MKSIWKFAVLMLAASSSVPAQSHAAVHNFVFGGPYATVSYASHGTTQQYSGAGSWFKVYPAPKLELYIDPVAQFGASFTISQIQSISYHTVNDATNPSDVDFYLQIYTMPYAGGDASWYGNRLNAEPMYSDAYVPPVAWMWNTWNTDAGTNQLTFFDGNHTTNFGFYGGPTLQDIQAGPITWASYPGAGVGSDPNPIDYASQTVKYVNISTGSGWAVFSGYVDAITIALNTGDSYVIDLESLTDPVYVDDNWSGLPPGIEIEPGKFSAFNAFATIQNGVNYVSGSTVYVAAGTYHENIVINKPLSLVGAGAADVIVYPMFSDVGPEGPPSFGNSQLCVVEAHDVSIGGMTFDGDSPTLTPVGTLDARNGIITNFNLGNWNNLHVSDCIVRNIYLRGIYASASGGSSGHLVVNNVVDNVKGVYMQSAAIMYYAATGDIVNNMVSNASLGIFFQAGSDGSADSNVVSGCDVGIGANNNNAATSISYNAINDCGNGGGIQLIMSQIATDVGYNTLSQCTTGVVIYGGNPAYRQDVHHNVVTGTDLVVSTGVYASTDVSPYGFSPVSAILRNNKISAHGFGVVLAELPAVQTNLMDVIIGGAAADMDSLFGNGVQELLLQDCNDNINARFNYWGVTECDSIEGRIFHQPDLASLGVVDYSDAPCHFCPVEVTGDVDNNNAVTSSDIIYLVNYAFKSGPAPLPVWQSGDVDCSGAVTATDIIYLVNFVFRSGTPPCDVCTML